MAEIPPYLRVANLIKAEWFGRDAWPSGTKLPTQEELAVQFGVSRSTIVRALSHLTSDGFLYSQQGSGIFVSDMAAPCASASCISMVVPELGPPVIVAVCKGVEKRARQMGFQVLLASSEYSLLRERQIVEQHAQAGSKGIIIYPVTRRRKDLDTDYLTQEGMQVPLITIDIVCDDWKCSKVVFDNFRAGYEMTQMLLMRGHRRIAFMHTHSDRLHSSIHDRQMGWRAALQDACIDIPRSYEKWPVSVHDFNVGLHDGDYCDIARSLLALQPQPDAVIAWADGAAAHLIQTLSLLGVQVPNQVRVTGFDNDPMVSKLVRPLFPTTNPDFVRLGEIAVDALKHLSETATRQPRTYLYSVPVLWRSHDVKSSPTLVQGSVSAISR